MGDPPHTNSPSVKLIRAAHTLRPNTYLRVSIPGWPHGNFVAATSRGVHMRQEPEKAIAQSEPGATVGDINVPRFH